MDKTQISPNEKHNIGQISDKRYYWLQLPNDFFDENRLRILRRLPSGDSLCIIYIKMLLKSLKSNCILPYDGILPEYESELALSLDEDEENVKTCVDALIKYGMAEKLENNDIYLPEAKK